MNRHQRAFEYEFVPFEKSDAFLAPLCSDGVVDRDQTKAGVGSFATRLEASLRRAVEAYGLHDTLPDYFIVISTASFNDNYYSMRRRNVAIIALGNWKRVMAPPSLLEFVQTLIVRESVAAISPTLRGSVHLGTKGCLFDFTPSLEEVRDKVLSAFICSHCRDALAADGLAELVPQLEYVLAKAWLGKPTDPETPAGVAFNLGYDLFVTRGLRPTPWESVRSTLRQEGTKQIATITGGVLVAALLVIFGLK
jgi:hypothetical protein